MGGKRRVIVGDVQRPPHSPDADGQSDADTGRLGIPRIQRQGPAPRSDVQWNQPDINGRLRCCSRYLNPSCVSAPLAAGNYLLKQNRPLLRLIGTRCLTHAADRRLAFGYLGFGRDVLAETRCVRFGQRFFAGSKQNGNLCRMPAPVQIEQQQVFAVAECIEIEFFANDRERHRRRQAQP